MDYKHSLPQTTAQPVHARARGVLSRFMHLLLSAFIVFSVGSCAKFPDPQKDDEGHASFAREIIPVMLGRRAHGVDEVEVIADISELYGRKTVIEMLMRDPQFVDHWTHVILDLLNVQRNNVGGIAAQDSSCWGEPTRDTPDPAIAIWVRDHAPGDPGAPTPAWNMTDLIQSAIVLDDLSPIYRANLFPMSMRRAGSNGQRDAMKDHFMKTYLNRNITCLRCHNPTYSASNKTDGGGNIVWRRLWTPTGHPEKALFGDYLDEVAANSRVSLVMRGDIRKPAAGGFGSRPWGMMDACATDTTSRLGRNNGTVTHTGFQAAGSTNYPSAGFGSLDGGVNPKVSLWELEASLHQGIVDLQDGYQRFTPAPSADELVCGIVEVFSGNCTGCHSGGSPSAGMNLSSDPVAALVNVDTQGPNSTNAKRVVPNSTATSELSRRIHANTVPPRMPPGGGALSASDIAKIDDWINAGAPDGDPSNCSSSDIPDVHPDEAFAFLTASNLVDGIWMSTMGYRLTIDHGFPRNRKQRDALWNLTEYTFLKSDWSLKSVLRKVLGSNWMGRRAPTISHGSTAYQLPMVLNPWVEADPTEVSNPAPHEKANGQGEMVNRYRVNTVLRQIGHALNWKQPRAFPSFGGYDAPYGYPSPLDENLGQYLSPAVPGFNGINFQSLLSLEDEIGLCEKSGHALESDDWINRLVNEVQNFNASNADAPLTVGEVWSILKDRMIQDTTIERELPSALAGNPDAMTEEQALMALINQGLGTSLTLNSPATDLSAAQLEGKLREGCGVLVKTPEFLLTNVTPRGYSDNNMPDPPRLNVCMDGENCGYAASCGHWRSKLFKMGKYTACEDRSVRKSPLLVAIPLPNDLVFANVNRRLVELCPGPICGYIEQPRLDPCLRNPDDCDPLPPVPMDLQADDGIVGQLPADAHLPGSLVLWADGAEVKSAKSVLHRRAGQRQWQPLQGGTRLATGDNLYVPLTASLAINAGDQVISTSSIKEKEIEGVRAHVITITGDNAMSVLDKFYTAKGALSVSQLSRGLNAGRYESQAISEKQWKRIIAYDGKASSKYTPSVEEVLAINEDYDALHFPAESGMSPDGTDLPDGQTVPAPGDGQDDDTDDDSGKSNNELIIYVIVIMLVIAFVLFLRKRK